nr:nucleoside diphosphate kinase 6 isoform X1 [Odocoileus virginianus texanus]
MAEFDFWDHRTEVPMSSLAFRWGLLTFLIHDLLPSSREQQGVSFLQVLGCKGSPGVFWLAWVSRSLRCSLSLTFIFGMAFIQAVHQQILSNKFLIVRMRELLWRKEDCRKFYREHEGRFFYQRLVEFMASGPIRAYILAHKDAIQLWRTVMGPTRVFRARHVAPDSIRGSFGLTDTRNTTHGSDSVVSASREIAAFFPDFSEQRWYEEEEPHLRCGPVHYSPEGGIHFAAPAGGPGPA